MTMVEQPQRKGTRLRDFDYSENGAYFLTVCVQNRRNILSVIVGEGSPLPELTPYGKVVNGWIERIPEKYPGICVDCYAIMPNHIHLLLSVSKMDGRGDPSPTVDAVMGWLKYQSTKEINAMRGTIGEKVFQRSFHDHVVRNREDYQEIYQYICENPLRWRFDVLYAEG